MKKIRGVVDRIEGENMIIKNNGNELLVPKKIVSAKPGETIVITFSSEADDSRKSNEIAKDLLMQALKGE
jgi:hypothetical protein